MGSADSHSAVRALELDRLITEYFDLQREGRAPEPEAFIASHPEHEHALRAVLPGASLLDQLGKRAQDAAEPSIRSGDRLGEFKLLGILGRGGMGIVYEAVQESLDRPVALKVLPASRVVDRKSRERFMREAQAAASLQHRGIVPVYGVGEAEGQVYYAMQRIDGVPLDVLSAAASGEPVSSDSTLLVQRATSLAERMRTGTFDSSTGGPGRGAGAAGSSSADVRQGASTSDVLGGSSASARVSRVWTENVVRIVLQAAEAISYAHSRGVLHRDIKPSNLMLDDDGRVFVTDFGLCKTGDNSSLTAAGDVVGTLRYVPPERFQGREDARGDVYGLGLILYELLTGRPAFPQGDRAQLVQAVTLQSPPRPRKLSPELPEDLERIVLRATAKLPEERYPSAEALMADLGAFLAGRPIRARAPGKLYLARLFYRRNRALVMVTLAAGVLLAVGGALHILRLNRLVDELATSRSRAVDAARNADLGAAASLIDGGREYLARQHLDNVPEAARDWVWTHLDARLIDPVLTVGAGEIAVVDAALDATGERLAVLRDEDVRVHDAHTGALLSTLPSAGGSAVAFLPGADALLLVEGELGEPRVAMVSGKSVPADGPARAYAGALEALALPRIEDVAAHPDHVALAARDGRVVVLSGSDPSAPTVHRGDLASESRIALVGSDGTVARLADRRRVVVHGPEPGRRRRVAAPSGARRPIEIGGSSDAPVFFLLTPGGRIYRYELGEGDLVRDDDPLEASDVIGCDRGAVIIGASPDGEGVLSAVQRGAARVWTRDQGTSPQRVRALPSRPSVLIWPPDGRSVITAGNGGDWRRVPFPRYDQGRPGISRQRPGFHHVDHLDHSVSGEVFAVAESTGVWSVWSSDRRLPLAAATDVLGWIRDISVTEGVDGELLVGLASDGLRALRVRPSAGQPAQIEMLATLPPPVPPEQFVVCEWVELGGRPWLVGVDSGGRVLALAADPDGEPRELGAVPARSELAFCAPLGVLFHGTQGGAIGVLDLGSGVGRELCRDVGRVVALSVDRWTGGVIAALTQEQELVLVDRWRGTEPPRVRRTPVGQRSAGHGAVAVDEAGGWVVTGARDGTVRTWAMDTGRAGPRLIEVYGQISDVEFAVPGEPPVVLERRGRLDHFEVDTVDRSVGSPGIVASEGEASALEQLSAPARFARTREWLEDPDLSLTQLVALRQTLSGLEFFARYNPAILDPRAAAAAHREADRRERQMRLDLGQ